MAQQIFSDQDLRMAILSTFEADDRVPTTLRVGVLNGIAHLAGKADSLVVRTAAEELAWHVPGLRGVVNRIEAPGAPSPAREINLDLNTKSELSKSKGDNL